MNEREQRDYSRREVLKSAGAMAGALTVGSSAIAADSGKASVAKPTMCLFSKALKNRPFTELPAMLTKLGVDAVDLTCRPTGHIEPARVKEDLPRAFDMFKAAGISVPMITTGIVDANEPHAEATIRTASELGIRHAKIGYYRYDDLSRIGKTLADVKSKLRDIAALCKQYGVTAGCHNHSGRYVGGPLWDLSQLIGDLNGDAIGSYFDIGHATAEGGIEGWRIGMHLLMDRISILGVKDLGFYRDPIKGWGPVWGPLGEGMVDLQAVFSALKARSFAGPIALHVEYGQFTSPVGSKEDRANLGYIRRDVAYLKKTIKQAGLA